MLWTRSRRPSIPRSREPSVTNFNRSFCQDYKIMITLALMKINDNMFDSRPGRRNSLTVIMMFMVKMVMMVTMMTMMAKKYLKWVGKTKQFNDKEGEVFQFGRGDRVVLAHHLS